jgi:hypothetical protein
MAEKEKKEVIDIADFFTTTRSKTGVWHEPVLNGVGMGIEFKILGPSSDEAVIASEEYDRAHEKALSEKDGRTAVEIERQALAERAASIIREVRAKGGKALVCNKKEFKASKDELRTVMYENEDVCLDILMAAGKSATFMKRQ